MRNCLDVNIDLGLFSALAMELWMKEPVDNILWVEPIELNKSIDWYMETLGTDSLSIREARAVVLAMTLSGRRSLLPDETKSVIIKVATESNDLCFKIGAELLGAGTALKYRFENLEDCCLAFLLPEEYAEKVWETVREPLYTILMQGDISNLVGNEEVLAYLVDVVSSNVTLTNDKVDTFFKRLAEMRNKCVDPHKLQQLDVYVCYFLNHTLAKYSLCGRTLNQSGQSFLALTMKMITAMLSTKTPLKQEEKDFLSRVMKLYEVLPKKLNGTTSLREHLLDSIMLRNTDTLLWLFREYADWFGEKANIFAVSPIDLRFEDLWKKCSMDEAHIFMSNYLRAVQDVRLTKDWVTQQMKEFEERCGSGYLENLSERTRELVPYRKLLIAGVVCLEDMDIVHMPKTLWEELNSIVVSIGAEQFVTMLIPSMKKYGHLMFAAERLDLSWAVTMSWRELRFSNEVLELELECRRELIDWLATYIFHKNPDKYVQTLLYILNTKQAKEVYTADEVSILVTKLKEVPGISSYVGSRVLLDTTSTSRTFEDISKELMESGSLSPSSIDEFVSLVKNWDVGEDDYDAICEISSFLYETGHYTEEEYEELVLRLEGVGTYEY